MPAPRVAISACLTGEAVRYDGAHKHQRELLQALRGAVSIVPVCPEVGAGLSVPRPPLHLVVGSTTRVLGVEDRDLDVTAALSAYAAQAVQQQVAAGNLCGWIFQSRSPSCGLGSAPRVSTRGEELSPGDGVQAAQVRRELPWLLLREETELLEPAQRECFIALCHLLWRLRYAAEPLHRHRSLEAILPATCRERLGAAREQGDRDAYCTGLMAGLSGMTPAYCLRYLPKPLTDSA